jgi:phosphate transport system regulatory protein PhoU
MMREKYNAMLKALHDEMLTMGAMCEEAITTAIKALIGNDLSLIERVFAVDSGIDKKERDIEAMCLKLLLQQQPVASDLREISSALKMISDMERIGDQASDIAEITEYLIGHTERCEDDIRKMSAEATKMVIDSIDSFVRRDLELARSVIKYDDIVDNWFARIKTDLIGIIAEDYTHGEYYLDILMVAKYLERIADHATNIAEWVEYSITGLRSKDGVYPDNQEES